MHARHLGVYPWFFKSEFRIAVFYTEPTFETCRSGFEGSQGPTMRTNQQETKKHVQVPEGTARRAFRPCWDMTADAEMFLQLIHWVTYLCRNASTTKSLSSLCRTTKGR